MIPSLRRNALALIALAAMGLSVGCARWLHAGGELAALHNRDAEAQPIGDENCLDCHSTVGGFFETSIHKKVLGCETCHGNGEKHASDGPGHIANAADLRSMSAYGKSSMCTECHKDRRASWPESAHSKAGLACFECHTDAVHFTQETNVKPPSQFKDEPGRFCEQCHADDVAMANQPFRHPMGDGEVTCNDCHAVHGEDAFRMEKSAGAGCVTCHADEASPKVFRHGGMDDGCVTCHSPHGSSNAALLKETGNGLCLSCHLEPGFPTIANVDHRDKLASGAHCLDCHVEIHGSNSDPSLLGRIR
ncbi:MAG TPA: cytochrome c3 family protein [bacterium]|nr:cytochrome c3 family protein [bacterium]